MVRQALTADQIAIMAAGGSTLAASAAAPGVVVPVAATEGIGGAAPAAAAPAAAAPAVAAPAVAAPAVAAPAVAAAAAAPAAAVVTAAAAPAASDMLTFLQTQVAAKDTALLSANVEIAGLRARISDGEAAINGLKAIASTSISNMRVALGGAKTDMSALTATELLAQHEAAKTEFEKKFVVGGVAAVDAAQPQAAVVDINVSSAEAERLNRFLA